MNSIEVAKVHHISDTALKDGIDDVYDILQNKSREILTNKSKTTPLIYHYTSVDSLFNGIITKNVEDESKAISLMATDTEYLNDPKENEMNAKAIEILSTLDSDDISKELAKFIVDLKTSISKHDFITSFSLAVDSLPMWSLYAKKGEGIALGFDISTLIEGDKIILPCLYDKKQLINYRRDLLLCAKEKIKQKLQHKPDNEDYSLALFPLLNIFLSRLYKDSSYEYEQEYRFIDFDDDDIQYRSSNNLIIPYRLNFFSKKSITTCDTQCSSPVRLFAT